MGGRGNCQNGGRQAFAGGCLNAQNLLIELFVEELPPKALKKLGEAFASVLFEQLKSDGLATPNSLLTSFASPRRLAAHITSVSPQAADKSISQKLMPVKLCRDGKWVKIPGISCCKRISKNSSDFASQYQPEIENARPKAGHSVLSPLREIRRRSGYQPNCGLCACRSRSQTGPSGPP